MKSRFSNFGGDIHDLAVRERNTEMIQRILLQLLILASPSLTHSQQCHLSSIGRVL